MDEDRVKRAIDNYINDMTVSPEESLERAEDLVDHIQVSIEALKTDLGRSN
jgi:hypothetical protein